MSPTPLPDRGSHLAAGPRVAPRRAWLVADQAVAQRLAAHPILPLGDATRRRHARLVAMVLGIRALPGAGLGSIADVDVTLEAVERGALARQLKLPVATFDEALSHLLLAGVLRPVEDRTGVARFPADLVTDSALGSSVRWPSVVDRLTNPPRDGSQTALMLFRVFADRVPHPGAAVELPLSEAAADLGLGVDQVRRGVQALLATDCWRSEPQAGRASRYAMSSSVLWSPELGGTAAVSIQEPPATVDAAETAEVRDARDAATLGSPEVDGVPTSDSGWTIVIPPGVHFTLPSQARDAQVSIDAQGRLVIRIDGARR